jgi:uncharacterized protein (TIGR00297 family)
VTPRALAGALAAAAIAFVAWRAGALSRSGAVAATIVGTLAVVAGWGWGALLVAYFVSSSALSHLRTDVKERRTSSVVAKGGARDAIQVMANGGIFALAAVSSLVAPWSGWSVLGAGALAASAADTWGTEIGTLATAPPRLITSWRAVPTGTSGGVSAPGLLATAAGALFVSVMAWLLLRQSERAALAVALGGIFGALADSLVGALWQSRRRCPTCGVGTERVVHHCGTPSERAGGLPWLSNDGVNVLCGIAGGLIALAAS